MSNKNHLKKLTVTMTVADGLAGNIDHLEPLLEPFHDVLIFNVLVCFEFCESLLQELEDVFESSIIAEICCRKLKSKH